MLDTLRHDGLASDLPFHTFAVMSLRDTRGLCMNFTMRFARNTLLPNPRCSEDSSDVYFSNCLPYATTRKGFGQPG
jgi:hypothetical protein